ncbi:MAG: hypothetical protein GX562_05460, partial [Coriobacteriaceae bacterium]|nr:hypothetical protein [Coriobacteriaceae bacterium]
MKQKHGITTRLLVGLLSLFLLSAQATPGMAVVGQNTNGLDVPTVQAGYVEGEVIAVLADDLDSQQRLQVLDELGEADNVAQTQTITPNATRNTTMVRIELADGTTVKDAIAEIEDRPDVAFAQPNFIYSLTDDDISLEQATISSSEAISDPYRDLQWALDIIGADEAAQLPMPDNQIEVAVIDTGVDV